MLHYIPLSSVFAHTSIIVSLFLCSAPEPEQQWLTRGSGPVIGLASEGRVSDRDLRAQQREIPAAVARVRPFANVRRLRIQPHTHSFALSAYVCTRARV